MTAARPKRLQRLEVRRPPAFIPFDDAAAIALLHWHLENYAAVDAGKACLIPVFGPHPEPSDAMRRVMQDLDRIAARLAAERAKDGR